MTIRGIGSTFETMHKNEIYMIGGRTSVAMNCLKDDKLLSH